MKRGGPRERISEYTLVSTPPGVAGVKCGHDRSSPQLCGDDRGDLIPFHLPHESHRPHRSFLVAVLGLVQRNGWCRVLVVACLFLIAASGLGAYLLTPKVLHVVRKQVEGHRNRQFVGHLHRPQGEISETFYADLEALDEFMIGMTGMDVHHGMGSGAGGMNEQNKKNGENGKKGGRRKKSDDGSSVGNDVGIVVPCGNTRLMLRNLYTSLAALRDGLRSTVPVTVSYYGSREPIDEAVRERFAARFSDVSFMDLSAENGAFEYPAHQRGIDNDNTAYFGFKAKVLALYAAPYRHVLLLDSDSVPLVDPARLFASKTYVEHGNVFWPDRWCEPVPLFDELSLLAKTDARSLQSLQSLRSFRQTDSGQVLFDRARYRDVLEYLLFLNAHDEYTYRLAYGDKDTYEAAFLLAGRRGEFYQVKTGPSVGLSARNKPLGFLQESIEGMMMNGKGKIRNDVDKSKSKSKNLAFVHRTSEAKRSSLGEMKWVLWHTDCHWNELNWQFFRPITWGPGGRVGWEEYEGWGVGGAAWEAAAVGWEEYEACVHHDDDHDDNDDERGVN